MWVGARVWAWLAVWASMGVRATRAACTMAEFPCRNKQCVSLDLYCDGQKDCDDGSDEPNACSPCNRTYYGRVGATYTLQVAKPGRGTLPHFCQLTFVASGDDFGDLVQISFDKFNLGRFVSHTTAGCPDGYMQIEELSRPLNAGYWCGAAWGHNVYYSETSAVTLMLRVFNRIEESGPANPGSFSPQDSVLLKVTYRFFKKEKAVLRYGVPYNPSYRGEDVTNSFCDKNFENCDKKNCKVQSPNYPGLYPRNLTCYYHIRQTRVPDGKLALIRVHQRNPHLIYIKDRNAPHLSRERRMRVGSACHVLHDYLIAFDGSTTRTPVLATICKGGAPLSGITSSGPDMLLVFQASPFDFPFQDSPRRLIFGFELDVEVEFVDRESTAYVRRGAGCQYMVSSRGQRSGYLQAPAHSLLPNTTCSWRLLAATTEVVWLYFVHYRHAIHSEMPPPSKCSNTLTIFDGDPTTEEPEVISVDKRLGGEVDNTTYSTTILGRFCRPEKLPRVCSGVHAPGQHSAPCSPSESYVSRSPALTLSLRYAAGTAPAHVEFLARYEFVDKRQWGDPTPGGGICDRIFTLRPDRLFASPRDVFLFGRGGTKRLQCVYTFKAARHQRISIRIIRSRMGSSCSTIYRQASQRFECSHDGARDEAAIWVKEEPWEGVQLTRACLCNTSHDSPFHLVSYTNKLDVVFSIPVMTAAHDYTDFFFEGEYSMLDAGPTLRSAKCDESARRLSGRHGNFTVGGWPSDHCSGLPRLVTATDGSFLFLRLHGHVASENNCGVAARINVYSAGGVTPVASVCPGQRQEYTHVFSNGWRHPEELLEESFSWNNKSVSGQQKSRRQHSQTQQETRDLLVEYVGNSTGRYMVTWVGVWRPLQTAPLSPAGADLCPHRCPEIQACLPKELWCDGDAHCPSGMDEGAGACGFLAALPWVYLAAGIILLMSLVALLVAVVMHRRRTLAVKADATEVVENNSHSSHSVKSATHDLLLPLEKESW
ncbi:uncharacterized protein LOC122245815 [Penaeus japonicus]|uniref:uncharacterized protein LOC122245815 n=2 Tax=Penaeus japonicus TaxID=27405 RepID=UPI001C714F06|nr:uncharacterized protein LOC122245815 [Penaeus japonicus]